MWIARYAKLGHQSRFVWKDSTEFLGSNNGQIPGNGRKLGDAISESKQRGISTGFLEYLELILLTAPFPAVLFNIILKLRIVVLGMSCSNMIMVK